MPAMLDDPTASVIYRVSGEPPYPTPGDTRLPPNIYPRAVTLRDRITQATLLPFSSPDQVPGRLLAYLSEQLNREIEIGDTYPMITNMSMTAFGTYWFQNFGAIMVTGEVDSTDDLAQMENNGADWSKLCLGSFYIKPNYPGRSSHICNGGFLVTDASRNKGVGRLMGECYLEWAPQLGYNYSVFNLVYETNVASCRIWDALGFKRIGRVKGAGALRSRPDEFIDAIIYGRDLGPEGEDFVSEERFDKIRYYLKHSKYPAGADRAEKSRLRSAATHYKLIPNPEGGEERLMLKDKEVVSDPQRQYEIARQVHVQTHGGINKTTASIAERYHWVRIKETVSLVIKNCPECKDPNKTVSGRQEMLGGLGGGNGRKPTTASAGAIAALDPNREIERLVSFDQTQSMQPMSQRQVVDGNGNSHALSKKNRRSQTTAQDVEMQIGIEPQQRAQPSPPQQQQMQHHNTQQHPQQHILPPMKPEQQTPRFQHQGPPPPLPQQQSLSQLQQSPFGPPHQQQQAQPPHQQHQNPQQAQQPTPQQQASMMHGLRAYDEMPLDPQIMSYGPHGMPQPGSMHNPLGPHPGLRNPGHGMADQSGLAGMGHPMGDPGIGGHVDQHGSLQLGMSMGGMGHPDAFDLSGMGHPGAQHDGMGMGLPDGSTDRMDTTGGDAVADGELGRQLLQATYGQPHPGA